MSNLLKQYPRAPLALLIALSFAMGALAATLWSLIEVVGGWSAADLEHAKLVAMVVSSCATICAVVVALFKEELRSVWDRARLEFHDPRWLDEDLDSAGGGTGAPGPRIALGYPSKVRLRNSGSQAAKLCEVILVELYEWRGTTSAYSAVEVASSPLPWTDAEEPRVLIPPGRHMTVEFACLRKSAAGKGEEAAPSLQLGSSNLRKAGKWRGKFTVFSENGGTSSQWVEVWWNGGWHDRLAEMKADYGVRPIQNLQDKG